MIKDREKKGWAWENMGVYYSCQVRYKIAQTMDHQDCFGILKKVFPLKESGLREVPQECFECPDRVLCLKTAISTEEGLGMRVENLDRTPATGFPGRLKRWSERKALSRQIERSREKKRKWWK